MPKRVELIQKINIFLLQTEEVHASTPHLDNQKVRT